MRTSKEEAQADLALARASASREVYCQCLKDLHGAADMSLARQSPGNFNIVASGSIGEMALAKPSTAASPLPRKRCRVKSPAMPQAAREHQDTTSAEAKEMPAGEWHQMPLAEASEDVNCLSRGVVSDKLKDPVECI